MKNFTGGEIVVIMALTIIVIWAGFTYPPEVGKSAIRIAPNFFKGSFIPSRNFTGRLFVRIQISDEYKAKHPENYYFSISAFLDGIYHLQ